MNDFTLDSVMYMSDEDSNAIKFAVHFELVDDGKFSGKVKRETYAPDEDWDVPGVLRIVSSEEREYEFDSWFELAKFLGDEDFLSERYLLK